MTKRIKPILVGKTDRQNCVIKSLREWDKAYKIKMKKVTVKPKKRTLDKYTIKQTLV